MTEAKEAAGDKNVLVHSAGTAQLALPDAGFPRPSGHGAPEQRERPDLFVGWLLGPRAKDLELLPVVGRLDAASAPSLAHIRSPSLCGAAGTEGWRDGCLRARGSILAGTWDVPAALAPAMGRRVYGEVCNEQLSGPCMSSSASPTSLSNIRLREASATKSVLPLQITVKLLSKSFMEELGLFFTSVFYLQMPRK
jgi:hypothetical protein